MENIMFSGKVLEKYKNKGMQCRCGRMHDCDLNHIYTGSDAIMQLKSYLVSRYGENFYVYILCDFNTSAVSIGLASELGKNCGLIVLTVNEFHADMVMVAEAKQKIFKREREYSCFIAAGTGTIHDITRMAAFDLGKDFISFPTAASVDGFVSSSAPVTVDGMKKTFPAKSPVALFADIKILREAPVRMTASGIGDLLGKYICIADWKTSALLTGEYICENLCDEVISAADRVCELLVAYESNKSEELYERLCFVLLDALIISGLCMSFANNTRPASGAEHHIAHFLEMGVLFESDYLHGENVAVGSLLCAKFYRQFLSCEKGETEYIKNPDSDQKIIGQVFGSISGDVMEEYDAYNSNNINTGALSAAFDDISELIYHLPSEEDISHLFGILCGVDIFGGLRYNNGKLPDNADIMIFQFSQYVRKRFTIQKLINNIFIKDNRSLNEDENL